MYWWLSSPGVDKKELSLVATTAYDWVRGEARLTCLFVALAEWAWG